MNRSSFALLGSVVLATAGVAITTSSPSTAGIDPKAGKSPGNQTEQQILTGQTVGRQLKQNQQDNAIEALPLVANAVLKDASQRTGIPASDLNLVEVRQQAWSDGCLGLGGTGVFCTQAVVPGWKVIVASGENRWVYRTNQSGTLVKWDEAASQSAIARINTPARSQQRPALRPIQLPDQVTRQTQPPPERVTRQTQPSPERVTRQTQPSPQPVPSQTQPSTERVTRQIQPSPQPSTERVTRQIQPSPQPVPSQTQQPTTSQPASVSFTDVPANHWAKDFISELAEKEIVKGYLGRYRPNEPVTRGELAGMLSLAFPKPKIRDAVDFKDVKPDEWVHSYIQDAYVRGFLELEPGNVANPNKQVSRLDVLVALARGLNYSPTGSPQKVLQVYKDGSEIPRNLRNLVAAATERGLVVNYPNIKLLKPNQVATRAEVAALIYQGMVSTGKAIGISSPYLVVGQKKTAEAASTRQATSSLHRNSNQRVGNGSPKP
ncbi:MAG TPA: S-layer homology domain-containing protein [Candidatus Obscuribacterales bacterium]